MIGWLVEDFVHDVLCYWIGLAFLKAITFGRFPNLEKEQNLKNLIKLSGLIVLVASLSGIGWALS